MNDIVFLDTETLGLDPDAPIWEFAAIRCRTGRPVETREFFIEHDPGHHLATLPLSFRLDYDTRFDQDSAYTEGTAAEEIHYITNGAVVVGACPNFDTERLALLLRRNGIEPAWHYHLCDVENLVTGYLAARGDLRPPPWNSNDLSAAVGVDPETFLRHTAMGDARWCQAQYHAVMTAEPRRDVHLVRIYDAMWEKVANLAVEDWKDGTFTLPADHPRAQWFTTHSPSSPIHLLVEATPELRWLVTQWSIDVNDVLTVHATPVEEWTRLGLATDAHVMATEAVEIP